MVAPVEGFRAVRAARWAFSKTPNPVMATLSPLATVCWMVSSTALTASVAVFLSPNRPEIASIRSRLFIVPPVPPCSLETRGNRGRVQTLNADLISVSGFLSPSDPAQPACDLGVLKVELRLFGPALSPIKAYEPPEFGRIPEEHWLCDGHL